MVFWVTWQGLPEAAPVMKAVPRRSDAIFLNEVQIKALGHGGSKRL